MFTRSMYDDEATIHHLSVNTIDNKIFEDSCLAKRKDNETRVEKIGTKKRENEKFASIIKSIWDKRYEVLRTSDDSLIDLICSPERIDYSQDVVVETRKLNDETTFNDEIRNNIEKKERRPKERKSACERDKETTMGMAFNTDQGHKTVPPLRLKKIQSPQEDCGNIDKRKNDHYDVIANLKNAGNYRIVTGHTPPCGDNVCEETPSNELTLDDSLDAAKIRYKMRKLKVKLRKLKRKTVEFGNDTMRTVVGSSSGSRTLREIRIHQSMNSYKKHMKKLKKSLNDMMPRVAKNICIKNDLNVDWQVIQSSVTSINDNEFQSINSPARTACGSDSSSRRSSLATRLLEDYEVLNEGTSETKNRIDDPNDEKSLTRYSSTNPHDIIIEKPSIDIYETKGNIFDNFIDNVTDVARDEKTNAKVEENEGIVNIADEIVIDQNFGNDGRVISEQFPTISNWIARLLKKHMSPEESNGKLPENSTIEGRSSTFQVFGPDTVQTPTPQVPLIIGSSFAEDNLLAPQWRKDRWQEQPVQQQAQQQQPQPKHQQEQQPPQEHPPQQQQQQTQLQQQQQTLPQSYGTANVPLQPPPAALGQEFRPSASIAMARMLMRNSVRLLHQSIIRF